MKSPITGKEMKLVKEQREMTFRKENFEIVFHYYQCEDSGESFTTTALDEVNMNQVYNQYREKFHIPFPDEICRIRKKYGVPAAKMAEILGFGINSYRHYESGEMPSTANAKLIQMINDPQIFREMVELCSSLELKTKRKYIEKAQLLSEEKQRNTPRTHVQEYLLGSPLADRFSGYRNPSLEKLTEMVVFFSHSLSPYKTKLNKLLFYADFLMFKQTCFSISGVRYVAIDLGPVPDNFQSLFEFMANEKNIDITTTEFPSGYSGDLFKGREDRKFNSELFTEVELETLNKVAHLFRDTSTIQTVELSHLEEAWKKNKKDKGVISYEYAFELNLLKH